MNLDDTKEYKKIGLSNYNDLILDLYDANPIANLGADYSKKLKLTESSTGNDKKPRSGTLVKETLRLRNTAVLNVKLKEKIFKWEKERFSQLKPYLPTKDKGKGTKTVINIDGDDDPPKFKFPKIKVPRFKFSKGSLFKGKFKIPITQYAPAPKIAPQTQGAGEGIKIPGLQLPPIFGPERKREGSDAPRGIPQFPPIFGPGIRQIPRILGPILRPLLPGPIAAAPGIGPVNVPANSFSFSKNNQRSIKEIFNNVIGGGGLPNSKSLPKVDKGLFSTLKNIATNRAVQQGGMRLTQLGLVGLDIFGRTMEGQDTKQIVAGTGSGIVGAKASALAMAKIASPLLLAPEPTMVSKLLYGGLVLGASIVGGIGLSSLADKITGADKMGSYNSVFNNQFLAGTAPYQQQSRNLRSSQRANLTGIQGEMYDYIRSKGLSHNHTLGLLANIDRESSFDIDAVGDSGTSFGLFQWHGVRATAMKKAVPNWKTDWKGQIDYALTEPQNLSDVKPGAYQKETFADAKSAAFWWTKNWERPKDLKSARIKQSNYIDSISIRPPTTTQPNPTGSGTTPTGDRSINFYGDQGRDRSKEPGVDFSFGDYKSNYSLYDGVVVETGKLYGTNYGNVVTIRSIDPRTGKSFDAMYAHFANGTIKVTPGQTVKSGDYLGPVGWDHVRETPAPGAGNMTGPHTSLDFFEPNKFPGHVTMPYSNRQHIINSILDKKILPGLNSANEQKPQEKPPVTSKGPDADFLKNLNFNQDPNFLKPQETPQVTPATSGYGNDGGLNAPTPTKSKGPVETFMDFLPPIPDFYEIHKNLFKPKSSLNNFSEIGMIPEEDEDISEELVMAFASGIAANYGGTGQIQYVPVPIEIPGETFIASGPTPHWGYSLQTG